MHCWVVCQVDRTLGQSRTLAVGYRCRGRLGILNSTEPSASCAQRATTRPGARCGTQMYPPGSLSSVPCHKTAPWHPITLAPSLEGGLRVSFPPGAHDTPQRFLSHRSLLPQSSHVLFILPWLKEGVGTDLSERRLPNTANSSWLLDALS